MGFRKECVCEETSWFAKKQEWLSLTVLMTKKKKISHVAEAHLFVLLLSMGG